MRTWEVIGEIGKRATGKEGARKRETALADAKKLICKDDNKRKKKRKKEKKKEKKEKNLTFQFLFSSRDCEQFAESIVLPPPRRSNAFRRKKKGEEDGKS